MVGVKIKKTQNGLMARPPVVVILGHVDSGKTSILDFIRKTHIAEKESGGITQHIGAYQIEVGNPPSPKATEGRRKITFIDTPGHEAFSAMRSRGAKVADIAILVIDSCKGVEPQTKEAILHIKKANIPLIVALNKIDRQEANPEKAKRELTKEDVLVESMGGKVPAVEVSASTGKGIEELLEMIFLVGEMESLKSNSAIPAEGWIIESRLDSQAGIAAALIINQGTLKVGDIIGTPSAFGKIKDLKDFQGKLIERALPSDPVAVFGLESLPKVGENFKSFPSLEEARATIKTLEKREPSEVSPVSPDKAVLNVILKADYLGSLEAIENVLKEIPHEKVALTIIKLEAGEINETDIKLAKSGRAKILGFRVKANPVAKSLALREKIKIANFEVIYDLVEGVRKLMEAQIKPEIVRMDLGKMKVLAVFLTEKNRQVVGGRIFEGEIEKGSQLEVVRNEEMIGRGKIINLQKNKKDVEKARKGEECGILYEGDAKIEKDDVLAAFKEGRVKDDEL